MYIYIYVYIYVYIYIYMYIYVYIYLYIYIYYIIHPKRCCCSPFRHPRHRPGSSPKRRRWMSSSIVLRTARFLVAQGSPGMRNKDFSRVFYGDFMVILWWFNGDLLAHLPSGNGWHSYWTWSFIVDLPHLKMVTFHSYVGLPEGMWKLVILWWFNGDLMGFTLW